MRSQPGQRGKLTLRQMLNRVSASHTIPASMAAYFMAGNGDAYHTWAVVPLATWQFVRALLPDDASAQGEDAASPCAGSDAAERDRTHRWTSYKDDYDHRPPSLRQLSPYVFFMWWAVEARDDAFLVQEAGAARRGGRGRPALDRLPLADRHPRSLTHMARRREKPAFPQLLSDPPARPAPDADVGPRHERYAAFMLAVLATDDAVATLRAASPDATLWTLLLEWEARCGDGSDAGAVALAVQRHLDDFAQVRAFADGLVPVARSSLCAGCDALCARTPIGAPPCTAPAGQAAPRPSPCRRRRRRNRRRVGR
jgi:hypothetical protein